MPGDQPRSLFDDPLRFKPGAKPPPSYDEPSSFKPEGKRRSLFDDPLRFLPEDTPPPPSLFDDPLRSLEERIAMLEAPAQEIKGISLSPTRAALRRFRQDKAAVAALILLTLLFFFSLIFPPIYEHIGQPLREQISPGVAITISPEQYHSPQYQDYGRATQLP